MMNFCIDIGNSAIKWALFNEREIVNNGYVISHNIYDLPKVSADFYIISSTIGYDNIYEQIRTIYPNIIYLDHTTPLPITNDYKTPHTLGPDRLAAAIGAFTQVHNDVLVIDIGTAITYDYISASGHFKGGNISPGISMRLKALHEHTAKLPLINTIGDIPLLGYDTDTAIRSGVVNGIKYEIEHYIEGFFLKKPNIDIFLTGGEKIDFDNSLKNRIFADSLLVLKGLNEILIYINSKMN